MPTLSKHIIAVLFAGLAFAGLRAQPLHYEDFGGMQHVLESHLYRHGSNFHPDIRPFYLNDVNKIVNSDSLFANRIPGKSRVLHYLGSEHILGVKRKKYEISCDWLKDAVVSYDFSSSRFMFDGGTGLRLQSSFFGKLALAGTVEWNQTSFPGFVNQKISATRVIPGRGYAFRSDIGGFNYVDYSFYASWNFMKYFTLEAGMGKNFWGDGYRSLFLSDASYNYPYIKITTNVWKIKYVNLWTNFKDMTQTASSRWGNMQNKYGVFHYLSWDISKRVNVGFFEAIIWQQKDSTGSRGFDIGYLNPVIFLRPVEFSRGSPDNSLLGVSLRVKVGKKTSLYGQFLIDDIIVGEVKNGLINRVKRIFKPGDENLKYGYWTNKQAWQIGVRSYDLFKIRNFSCLLEFNFVRPYTYAHRIVVQNYGHYNEPLAHEGGANLWETSGFVWYSYRRWFFEGHVNYMVTGLDSLHSDFGQDIYKPAWDVEEPGLNNIPVQPYFNKIGQGIKTRIGYYSLRVSYMLNPRNNMRLYVGYYYRTSASAVSSNRASVVELGLRMSLPGRHYDY